MAAIYSFTKSKNNVRNEVVVGRAHLLFQRRLIDLTCHYLETMRQRRPASRWRYDLHKYWRDTIWQRTMQDRLTREATSCSKRVAWLTRVTFLSAAILNCCQLKITKPSTIFREDGAIGLYRDVWIAAIASSRKSLATQTAAICVRFHGRRVRHVYVTMQITFLARKSALIYRRGLRQRVASLTIDCNGVFAIRAYTVHGLSKETAIPKYIGLAADIALPTEAAEAN